MSEPDEFKALPDSSFSFVFVKAWKFNIKSYLLETRESKARFVEMWHAVRITDEIAHEHPMFAFHRAAYGEELSLPGITIGMN